MKLHRTTAYHPQANGLCERFHRSLKAALRASLKDCGWVDRLPWVMLGLRSAPKEDLQASSAELVYGQPLRVPGEFIPKVTDPGERNIVGKGQAVQTGAHIAARPAAVTRPIQPQVSGVCVCSPGLPPGNLSTPLYRAVSRSGGRRQSLQDRHGRPPGIRVGRPPETGTFGPGPAGKGGFTPTTGATSCPCTCPQQDPRGSLNGGPAPGPRDTESCGSIDPGPETLSGL